MDANQGRMPRISARYAHLVRTAAALCLALLTGASARGTTVQEVARIKGHGQSTLQGIGLVVGLPGTGDSGQELAVARPLMEMLRNNGNPIADTSELANSQSVALVSVSCTVPEDGALIDDRLDVTVSVINSATSLAGGQLYLTPLIGPFPGSPVYAVADGPLLIEEDRFPTRGRVAEGAKITQDILPGAVGSVFRLVLDEYRAGYGATAEIASSINADYFNAPGAAQLRIATPINHREVEVTVPPIERANAAAFIGQVLSTEINTALLRLPAQVFINRASGIINFTGDVEITPGVVTVRGMTVTTVVPELVPTPDDPAVERSRWVALGTDVDEGENARLQDLLTALNRLDVAIDQQIDIIRALHRNGQLHAKLVID